MGNTSKRPSAQGIRKPLTLDDPIEWWREEATRLGLTVDVLRAQVRAADELIEELIREERSDS